MADLEVIHRYCKDNKLSLKNSYFCGCFYCRLIYKSSKITKYVGQKVESAVCSYCGIDSVLGDWDVDISPKLLDAMHQRWFEDNSVKSQEALIEEKFYVKHYHNAKWWNIPFIWIFKTVNELKERLNEFEYPSNRIPYGQYCYTIDRIVYLDGDNHPPTIKTKPCPYWELIDGYHHQENGYCKKTGIKDWEAKGISLLWDGCKECGIKMDDPEDEYVQERILKMTPSNREMQELMQVSNSYPKIAAEELERPW